ncbi:hypothetical protein Tco_1142532 [Tanacetum coccineum]
MVLVMLVWWKLQQCFKRLKLQVKRSRRIKDMTLENPDKQKDCGVKEIKTRHCLGTLVIGDGGKKENSSSDGDLYCVVLDAQDSPTSDGNKLVIHKERRDRKT